MVPEPWTSAPAPAAPSANLRQRRPSLSATANAAAETVTSTAKQVASALHMHWDDLPDWRQDNHYIHSGYRQTSNSYLGSFHSLSYLHNETVNIWSHLLGAVFFTAVGLFLYNVVTPRYYEATTSASDVVVFACFFAGAFCCLGMSATYHTLCNHSAEVARWGNKLDYTGIVFLIVGSYVPAMWYGFFCFPGLLKVYLSAIVNLGLGCVAVSWIDRFRTPAWRPYRALMFVGLGVSGVGPILHGITIYGYSALNERMGLNWVILQGTMYIFGAFLYAARWPERQYPGAFDIWGSSHQIFHIFVVLAAAAHLYGMAKAFDFHHANHGALC
ncbi:hemolysin-III related-domain-containing protein [Apodospora peruviana]|uniref:Hemolysin-III related-domain-containing protein n=1 Tax=Apodospora peruviana TaxID=516989 RepID=A0AAE0M3S6_9PEZI|nr:hemolysin-III related-domain-containing protein [Apodospora peruviana]